ncbi:hypothetical protein BK002_22815 [Klebsiella pneumoniae]|nr:hypothetical protein BK002_22815 [Klebsiella pneumoniae]
MMSLWDALRMNMMISYQELVRTFPSSLTLNLFLERALQVNHFEHSKSRYVLSHIRLITNCNLMAKLRGGRNGE